MRIFNDTNSPWSEKVNFVDRNNVLVGYDMSQRCCEDAGWFMAEGITPFRYSENYEHSYCDHNGAHEGLEEYVFDADFFSAPESPDLGAGEMAVFRLVADGLPVLYLHLFNAHNGYYSHGFVMKHGEEVAREGDL